MLMICPGGKGGVVLMEWVGPVSTGLLGSPTCCSYLGGSLICSPGCRRCPGSSSDYGVFRGADTLIICPGRIRRLEELEITFKSYICT